MININSMQVQVEFASIHRISSSYGNWAMGSVRVMLFDIVLRWNVLLIMQSQEDAGLLAPVER
jgi:hypothetical protein